MFIKLKELLKKYLRIRKLRKEKNCKILTRFFSINASFGYNCEIGKNVLIGKNSEIGDNTYISSNSTIDSNVHIGKYCSIASNVLIAPGVHQYNYVTTHPILFNKYWRSKLKIIEHEIYDKKIGQENDNTYIGNDVWIATSAIIMRGVRIGNGAIIGAGAIVTKDVEPYSIVVGIPAKHIKYRFKENEINEIEKSEWWNKSTEELNTMLSYMYDIEKYLKWLKGRK